MKILRRFTTIFLFVMFIAAPAFSLVNPQMVSATSNPCDKDILTIPTWYRGLTDPNKDCELITPGGTLANKSTLDTAGFVWRIALNIIDIGLSLTGYIAFFFILFGGFQFLTGGSNPGQIEKARKTILNAVIGLAIALGAVAITNLIFGVLTK